MEQPRAPEGRGYRMPVASAAAYGHEADRGARRRLGGGSEIRGPHHPDHRVAPGGRVVGQEDDRSAVRGTWTAPSTIPSLGSSAVRAH